MLLMNEDDIKLMLMGVKTSTLRSVKPNGKGYLRVSSLQYCKFNFFDEWILRVKIIGRSFVDLDELTDDDLKSVGYSKEDYLMYDYNLKNASTKRVKYDFEIVEINEDKIREIYNGF